MLKKVALYSKRLLDSYVAVCGLQVWQWC